MKSATPAEPRNVSTTDVAAVVGSLSVAVCLRSSTYIVAPAAKTSGSVYRSTADRLQRKNVGVSLPSRPKNVCPAGRSIRKYRHADSDDPIHVIAKMAAKLSTSRPG